MLLLSVMDISCSLTVAGPAARQPLEFQRQISASPLPLQSLWFCGRWGGMSGERTVRTSPKERAGMQRDEHSSKGTPRQPAEKQRQMVFQAANRVSGVEHRTDTCKGRGNTCSRALYPSSFQVVLGLFIWTTRERRLRG